METTCPDPPVWQSLPQPFVSACCPSTVSCGIFSRPSLNISCVARVFIFSLSLSLCFSISLRLLLSSHVGKRFTTSLPRQTAISSLTHILFLSYSHAPPDHPPIQPSPHRLCGLSPSGELPDGGLTVAAHGPSIESLSGRAQRGHDTLGAGSTREQTGARLLARERIR